MVDKVIAETQTEFRTITMNNGKACSLSTFPSNERSTQKHSKIGLVPQVLFHQFSRPGNLWLLTLSILQGLFPLLGSWPLLSSLVPLILVLSSSLLQAVHAYCQKYSNDKALNSRITYMWNGERRVFTAISWREVRVGHILLVKKELVPADVVVLRTSTNTGELYVQTTRLNGGVDLELKKSNEDIAVLLEGRTVEMAMGGMFHFAGGVVDYDVPNGNVLSFKGEIKLQRFIRTFPLNLSNMVLRGSLIWDSPWTIVLVVYTGTQTRIGQTINRPKDKTSHFESIANKYTAYLIAFIMLISMLIIVVIVVVTENSPAKQSYFYGDSEYYWFPLIYMLLYGMLIPITFYIVIDFAPMFSSRKIQASIKSSLELVNSSSLHEELGQIEYIFTDKTGTLTENQMEFKKCYAAQKTYGEYTSLDSRPAVYQEHPKVSFTDPTLHEDLHVHKLEKIRELFLIMSLCHTATVSQGTHAYMDYQAISPDERALVTAAHCMGFSFHAYKEKNYYINVCGTMQSYAVLAINQFTFERRRMSILLKPLDTDSPPVLYCKGAYSVIITKCNGTEEELTEFGDKAEEFAFQGLRTLLYCKKELTEAEYQFYEKKYNFALKCIEDNTEILNELVDGLEYNMDVIGLSAVEDKIQEGVPETVTSLLRAGIKIWIVTGDAPGNTINAAYSSKLYNPNMFLEKLICSNVEDIEMRLIWLLRKYSKPREERYSIPLRKLPRLTETNSTRVERRTRHRQSSIFSLEMDLTTGNRIENFETINIGLVTDGTTLSFILNNAENAKKFFMLASLCQSVLCCRISPLQKARIVRLVKRNLEFHPVTMAVGDGLNDIPMMQEADVGVVVVGTGEKVSIQARNLSDYVAPMFKDLRQLILVEGSRQYQGIVKVFLLCVYKQFLVVFPVVLFSMFSLYSGSTLYIGKFYFELDIFVPVIPLIFLLVQYKEQDDSHLLDHPKLFKKNILGKSFSFRLVLKYTSYALLHGFIIFFSIFMMSGTINENGNTENIVITGSSIYLSYTYCYILMMGFEVRPFTFYYAMVLGLCPVLLCLALLSHNVLNSELKGLFGMLLSSPLLMIIPFMSALLCAVTKLVEILFPVFLKNGNDKIGPYLLQRSEDVQEDYFPIFRLGKYSTTLEQIFSTKNFEYIKQKAHKNSLLMDKFTLKYDDIITEKQYRDETIRKSINLSVFIN